MYIIVVNIMPHGEIIQKLQNSLLACFCLPLLLPVGSCHSHILFPCAAPYNTWYLVGPTGALLRPLWLLLQLLSPGFLSITRRRLPIFSSVTLQADILYTNSHLHEKVQMTTLSTFYNHKYTLVHIIHLLDLRDIFCNYREHFYLKY